MQMHCIAEVQLIFVEPRYLFLKKKIKYEGIFYTKKRKPNMHINFSITWCVDVRIPCVAKM